MTERTEREERDARTLIGDEINKVYGEILGTIENVKKDQLFDDLGNLKNCIAKNEYGHSEKILRNLLKDIDEEFSDTYTQKRKMLQSIDNVRKIMIKDLWNTPQEN